MDSIEITVQQYAESDSHASPALRQLYAALQEVEKLGADHEQFARDTAMRAYWTLPLAAKEAA